MSLSHLYLYLIIHSCSIYICPYGFGYYIPDILDYSCVSELCSSHYAREKQFVLNYDTLQEEESKLIKNYAQHGT